MRKWAVSSMRWRNEMKGNTVTVMFFILLGLVSLLPGLGAYLEMNMKHELKIACINAGKTPIEDSCVGGE